MGCAMANKPAKKKMCFVVGPIGDDDSDDRIHADWLLEDIITPVFDEHFEDFEVTRADKISNPGQITSQVITALLEAELVIADLTTLNPNAFYEIGIRHTMQLPIIHMHLEGQRIPFDIAPFRSIKFSRRRPVDIRSARAMLLEYVREATDAEHVIDNPVTFSRGKVEFDQKATPEQKILQEQMEYLGARVELVEMQLGNPILQANHHRMYGRSKKAIGVELRSRDNTTPVQLKGFLSSVFLEKFPDATLVEDNVSNLVLSIPDNDENRKKLETVRSESAFAAFAIDLLVNYY